MDAKSMLRLPGTRAERNREVRRRFDAYTCGLRPTQPFVSSLRNVGPFLVNLP